VGDLSIDSAVEGGAGSYTAHLHSDWNIWGPNGGYVAAVLLRAAGAHAGLARPVSVAVQFLGVADNGPVQLTATTLRRTRRAEAVSVAMAQEDRPVAAAMAWFVHDGLPGLDHDVTAMPAVPGPAELRSFDEHMAESERPPPPFPFWGNIEHWPTDWRPDWPPPGPLPPVADTWFRFRPRATFDDPLADAARLVVVLDTMGYPAATRAHAWSWAMDAPPPWVAPSLDLHVRFHRFAPDSALLLTRVEAPLATAGILSSEGRVWAEDGRLLASAGSQMLCTPSRAPEG
jgi:acyl-CoA thioesterase